MRRALVMFGLFVALAVLGVVVFVAIDPLSGPEPDAVEPSAAEDTISATSPGTSRTRGRNAPAVDRRTETVVGRVMLHGRPVVGTRVWVDGVEALTDELGRFEVADRPRGQHRIVAGGGEFLAEEVVTGPLTRPLRIALSRPRVREGVLVLPPGVPREGVEVTFQRRRGAVEQVVTTDAEGRFVGDRLRPYEHHVRMPSQRIGERIFFRTSVHAGRFDRDSVRLEPAPGEAISGVVRGPDGEPVQGARVQARGKWPRGSESHLGYATSDAAGEFEVIVPEGVSAKLIAWAPGQDGRGDRFAATLRTGVPPSSTDVALVLGAGQVVAGELLGADAEPLVGARLELRCARPGSSWVPVITAVTDRRGRFVAGGLLEGPVRARLSEDETKSRRLLLRQELRAPSNDVVLNAVASLRLRGRIVRPADLAERQLSFGFSGESRGAVDAWRLLGRSGEFDVARKPPGEYAVWVRIASDDRRRCGTITAGAEPVDLRVPPRE